MLLASPQREQSLFPIIKFKANDFQAVSDLRIVHSGSGGEILDIDWFHNYCGIKLVRQASEIERNNDMLAYCEY